MFKRDICNFYIQEAMRKILLKKLREISEDINSIAGEWPVVVGSFGYVLLGYLDWKHIYVTKDIDIFAPDIDSFEVADKLMEKGWNIVHYAFTNAVYIDTIPVEILSNTMANTYIPAALYKHWKEVSDIRVMEAPGLLLSQAIYRDVTKLTEYLKRAIPVDKTKEYLRECEEDIKNTFDYEKLKVIKERIDSFAMAQEVKFSGDRAWKDNSSPG